MPTRKFFREHVKSRKERAAINREIFSKRTPEQQIKELDRRLGTGVGATKERKKLLAIVTVERLKEKFAKK